MSMTDTDLCQSLPVPAGLSRSTANKNLLRLSEAKCKRNYGRTAANVLIARLGFEGYIRFLSVRRHPQLTTTRITHTSCSARYENINCYNKETFFCQLYKVYKFATCTTVQVIHSCIKRHNMCMCVVVVHCLLCACLRRRCIIIGGMKTFVSPAE